MCAGCEIGKFPQTTVEYEVDPNLNKFLVWSPSMGPPSVFHGKFADAKAQARRLAAKHPGAKFYTLHVMGRAVETGPSWVEVGQAPQ